jgi:hypothetical protein
VGGEQAVLELSALAKKAGIEVRIEPFFGGEGSALKQLAGKGGLCRIRGRRVILVDSALGPLEQAGVIGQALGSISLRGIEVPPDLLPFLKTGHAKVRPLVRPRPIKKT